MSNLNSLLLHPKTKKQATVFLQRPVSPLLILGESGSGKLKLAYSVVVSVLELKSADKLSSYPHFIHISKPENKQEISIDTVREIHRFVRLKTAGGSEIRRIVLLQDAQHLSDEAQNALLKMLEEPHTDTLFILTAFSEMRLLPTIVSRCQIIRTHSVTLEQANRHYGKTYRPHKVDSAWRLSRGSPSLMEALLADEDSHPLKEAIGQAKAFLGKPRYERLAGLEGMDKKKDELRLFLEALSKILAALHRNAVEKNRLKQARNLSSDRKLTLSSLDALDKNANARLLCLQLVLKLRN